MSQRAPVASPPRNPKPIPWSASSLRPCACPRPGKPSDALLPTGPRGMLLHRASLGLDLISINDPVAAQIPPMPCCSDPPDPVAREWPGLIVFDCGGERSKAALGCQPRVRCRSYPRSTRLPLSTVFGSRDSSNAAQLAQATSEVCHGWTLMLHLLILIHVENSAKLMPLSYRTQLGKLSGLSGQPAIQFA